MPGKTLSYKELREEISKKSALGHRALEEAGESLDFNQVTVLTDIEGDTNLQKFQTLQKELDELKKQYDPLHEAEMSKSKLAELNREFNKPKGIQFPDGKDGAAPELKSIGSLIMGEKQAKKAGYHAMFDINLKDYMQPELKTLMETGAGWAPESLRIPRIELYPTRKLVVTDFIPMLPTTQNSIKYMEETTYTSNAAEVAEGAAAGESAFAFTEQSAEVEKIAVFLPVTEEQLEDVPQAEGYINDRLAYQVRARLDGQVLEGDGSTPNLEGTLNVTSIQSQAKGTDPTPDAIYKCFTLIRSAGFAEPTVLFINPTDWQDIRLLRTADGIYVFGSPTEAGPDRIWGIPVVQTTAVTVNTALTGDYTNFSHLYIRRGLEVEMSSGYSDYFVKGKFAIKATMRCSMVHYRPEAFGEITGI